MNARRILILALFDLRHSVLRIKGLLFLLPFVLYWLAIIKLLHDGGAEFVVSQQGILITTFFLSPDMTHILFIDNPAVLSICLMLALTTLPMFCILAANNQLAGDAGRGAFRFLLTRCSRGELYLSRYLSCCVLVAAALLLMVAGMVYLSLRIDGFQLRDTLLYGISIVTVLIIYALPLLAFMTIFSASMSGAMGSLLFGAVSFFIILITSRWMDEDYPWTVYVLPNSLKPGLYDFTSPDLLLNLSGLVVFTLVYLCIGWLFFRRRNL